MAEAAPVEDEASRAPEAGRVGGEAVRPIIDWGPVDWGSGGPVDWEACRSLEGWRLRTAKR